MKDLPELITEFDERLWAGLIARDARVGQDQKEYNKRYDALVSH